MITEKKEPKDPLKLSFRLHNMEEREQMEQCMKNHNLTQVGVLLKGIESCEAEKKVAILTDEKNSLLEENEELRRQLTDYTNELDTNQQADKILKEIAAIFPGIEKELMLPTAVQNLKDQFTELRDNESKHIAHIETLTAEVEQLRNREPERIVTEVQLPENAVVMELSAFEKALLQLIARASGCVSIKELLVDRFFMVYEKRGNGDYNIRKIKDSKFREIKQKFDNIQDLQK